MMISGDTEGSFTASTTDDSKLLASAAAADTECGECDSENSASVRKQKIKDEMLGRVAHSPAYFKSQQRGDPELTLDEKYGIALDLLTKSPSLFLERFGKFLQVQDLGFFDELRSDYAVNFYVSDLEKNLGAKVMKTTVKNRRYNAMKELLEAGTYFSDEEMKSRDPLLYEQMVGQHLSEDEIQTQASQCDGSLSGLLMQHIEALHNTELYKVQVDKEESQMAEGDSDEEEQDEDEEMSEGDETKLSEAEKQMLRHEFLSIMKERFLSGEETDFNYSAVDGNQSYDPVDISDRDAEDRYFDEDGSAEEGMDDILGETGDEMGEVARDFRQQVCLQTDTQLHDEQ